MADEPLAFSYHRSIAPMMWVLVGLSSVELVVVHVLVAFWSMRAAVTLSLISLAGIGWLIATIAAFRRMPVLLFPDALIMRAGRVKSVTLSLTEVAGLRPAWDAAAVKQRCVLNLALIAYPNVVIDLHSPRPGRRAISAIAHRLDDPDRFTAALLARLGEAREPAIDHQRLRVEGRARATTGLADSDWPDNR